MSVQCGIVKADSAHGKAYCLTWLLRESRVEDLQPIVRGDLHKKNHFRLDVPHIVFSHNHQLIFQCDTFGAELGILKCLFRQAMPLSRLIAG